MRPYSLFTIHKVSTHRPFTLQNDFKKWHKFSKTAKICIGFTGLKTSLRLATTVDYTGGFWFKHPHMLCAQSNFSSKSLPSNVIFFLHSQSFCTVHSRLYCTSSRVYHENTDLRLQETFLLVTESSPGRNLPRSFSSSSTRTQRPSHTPSWPRF